MFGCFALVRSSTLLSNDADLLYSYHIYGLVVVLHSQIYAGVTLIVLPKFDLTQFLTITAKYKVDVHCKSPFSDSSIRLCSGIDIVPPMAVMLVKSPEAQKADLSPIKEIMVRPDRNMQLL